MSESKEMLEINMQELVEDAYGQQGCPCMPVSRYYPEGLPQESDLEPMLAFSNVEPIAGGQVALVTRGHWQYEIWFTPGVLKEDPPQAMLRATLALWARDQYEDCDGIELTNPRKLTVLLRQPGPCCI